MTDPRTAGPPTRAKLTLRPVDTADPAEVAAVLDLNHRNVEALAPMDADRLHRLRAGAERFDVVERAGGFAGFVVTFGPGSDYDSANYRWHAQRFAARGESFGYLDRIVLHESTRRQGVGSFVYDEVEASVRGHGRLALEVNLRPRNDASLAFHAGRGYVEVGRRAEGGHGVEADHLVSMQVKELA